MKNSNYKEKPKLKKFKLQTKYIHNRSEGLTWRRNGGSFMQFTK